MSTQQALQLIVIPHRPAKAEEIANDLAPAFAILQKYLSLPKSKKINSNFS